MTLSGMKMPLWQKLLLAQADLHMLQRTVFRLIQKFHAETDCGAPDHWAECEAVQSVFGYETWEAWQEFEGLVAEVDELERRRR